MSTEDDKLSDREIADRMDRAIKRMIATQPQPKRTPLKKQRPAGKGRVRKGRSRS